METFKNLITTTLASVLMLLGALFLLSILTGCGAYDEYEKWEDAAEDEVAESEEPTEDLDETGAPESRPDTLKTSRDPSVEVTVNVEVNVNTQDDEYREYALLEKGLTMDQVAAIVGEPDDAFHRAGPGSHWKLYKGRDACNDGVDCNLYFNGKGLLEYTLNIKPEYRNLRDY